MLTRVVAGNDFTIRINVVQPQYTIDGTIYEDFDITKCSDVKVCLICEQHKVVIPLSWKIEENTNNIILADIIGKQLHIGSVYGVQITGLDENNKAWRYKNKSVFSVVDATKDSLMDVELMDEPLELRTEISLFVNAIPIEGHQGPAGSQGPQGQRGQQGERGQDGQPGVQGSQGAQGAQGEKGQQGQQGAQGAKGQDGSISFDELTPEQKEELRGPQGVQGEKGQQGQQGAQGEKGADGSISFDELTPEQKEELRGPQGQAGQQGERGETGPQGQAGQQGAQGEKGDTGAQGPQGEKGQDGAPGQQGSQGPVGQQGPQGEKGDGADIEPVTLVVDEQMPQNPNPDAVYMIQKSIKLKTINNQDIVGEGNIEIQGGQVPSIIPSVSLNTSISNNVLTVAIVLYDSLENKLYNLQGYATHINKTISIATSSNIYVKFDNEDAFFINIGGFTIDTSNVSIDPNTGIITAPVLTQSANMTVEAQYCPEFWLDTLYAVNFDAFGPVKYVLSSSTNEVKITPSIPVFANTYNSTDNKFSITIYIYDMIQQKMYTIPEYAAQNGLTLSLQRTTNTSTPSPRSVLLINFDGVAAFNLNIKGCTVMRTPVYNFDTDGILVFTPDNIGQTVDFTLYHSSYWNKNTSTTTYTFSPYGLVTSSRTFSS